MCLALRLEGLWLRYTALPSGNHLATIWQPWDRSAFEMGATNVRSLQDNLSDNCDADGGMNDTKLANKSVTFAAHTTIYEKKVGESNRQSPCKSTLERLSNFADFNLFIRDVNLGLIIFCQFRWNFWPYDSYLK